MLLTRILDDKMLNLQRQGKISTFAQVKGQEACQIGSTYAMNKSDWMFSSFRENAAYITLGLPIENIIMYYGGDERGDKIPEAINCFTVCIPVSTQIPHAVGFAWAAKIKKEKLVSVVFFGDGATSEGDFHEAMNFAGVFKVPIVFICQNNQYAISLPRRLQSASETLAQKAIAYGFNGIQVDGNDVFAVYKATKEALAKARAGKGPTLIECVTYRLGDHTTADDATRYRLKKEVGYWLQRDPILRLRKYMEKIKVWNKNEEERLKHELENFVDASIEKAFSIPAPNPEDIFKYTYAEMTPNLKEQLNEIKGDENVGREDS